MRQCPMPKGELHQAYAQSYFALLEIITAHLKITKHG